MLFSIHNINFEWYKTISICCHHIGCVHEVENLSKYVVESIQNYILLCMVKFDLFLNNNHTSKNKLLKPLKQKYNIQNKSTFLFYAIF